MMSKQYNDTIVKEKHVAGYNTDTGSLQEQHVSFSKSPCPAAGSSTVLKMLEM